MNGRTLARIFPRVVWYSFVMTNDQSPATKADIAMIVEMIGKQYDAIKRWKEEMIQHFDLSIETFRHDFLAMKREQVDMLDDRTKDHGKRIHRLEAHIGI